LGRPARNPAARDRLSIPQVVSPAMDPCVLVSRWGIAQELAQRLVTMAGVLEFPISIISGLRTPAQQIALGQSGRPAADLDKSTHLSCPATGVDLRPAIAVTDVVKARLGAEGTFAGLRWGGGSSPDPRTGIPSDWNHFDLGPRRGG